MEGDAVSKGHTASRVRRETDESAPADEHTNGGGIPHLPITDKECYDLNILNQLPVGCILLGENSVVEFLNQTAEDVFGFSLEESRGKHPADLFVPKNERDNLISLLHETGETNTESRILESCTKNGSLLKCIWHSRMICDEQNNGSGLLITIEDVSKEKNIEAQLKQQIQYLRALRTIDLTISGSMDIQTILQVVLREAMEQLKMSAAVVLIFDPTTNLLSFTAGRGFRTDALESTKLHLGDGYAGRAALEKRIIQVPNLDPKKTDFLRSPNFYKEGFKSYYCVPLLSKGEIQGVLESFHRSLFIADQDWLNFFETLGGQAAIAIDSARLFTSLQRSNLDLKMAYDTMLEGWSRALDLRDHDTEGHTRRVTKLTEQLAVALNISAADQIHIRRGALLHDIGKIGIPDKILLKESTLTDEEWTVIHQHPATALELLKPIPYLESSLDIPYCHHERWDGSGYPRGLKGHQIPLAARIFSVVDVFDALTSDRPYRRAWPVQKALDYLQAESGKLFDPAIIDVFMRNIGITSQGKGNPATDLGWSS